LQLYQEYKELSMTKNKILGVILAGGLSRRMGGKNKFFKKINNITILDRIISKSAKQVDKLIINANISKNKFSKYKVIIVKDIIDGYMGPLAGILTGLNWAKKKKYEWIATYACDAPFFPDNLVKQFLCIAKKEKVDIVIAKSNGRKHPVFGLWSIKLLNSLERYLLNEKNKKIVFWVKKNRYKVLNFPYKKIDPFFNINNPDDLIIAKKIFHEMSL